MAEPTYRIKPLEWVFSSDLFGDERGAWSAEHPWGGYLVWASVNGGFRWTPDSMLRATPADSIEFAKAAAETHCRERLMVALEVVDE